MKVGEIDPSMSMAFSFRREAFPQFKESLLSLKSELKEDFFLYIAEEAPEYN